ncbi:MULTISPECIES: hypothetical protein [Haloferax]|uniref:Uncharacterized protein n=2 Tax=Haloferax TaxID=2251 RepID=A0A6G1Z111_9EURY|nr:MULTISPECIES: hypothetical protein [Haloferax]KAB1187476.1 hypothetical protein Hfx1149_05300 [Haloferax sp. CBA1149]MRW80128.1 hypothetical protein [Haloferax marinisediminis]
MNKTLWRIGVVFVVFGVMFAIVPTGSYSTIAGERSVGVSVAADDSALIALEGATGTVSKGSPVSVTLRNNLDSLATVTYEVVDSGALTVKTNGNQPITTDLASGDGVSLTAKCGPNSGGGPAETTLVIAVEATATGATITDGTVTTTVTYDCQSGNSKTVAFVDANENGGYDSGETTLTASQLATFTDTDAAVVINSSVNRQNSIDITAASVTIQGTTLKSTNGNVSVQATTGTLDARNSTLSANNNISLASSGDMLLNDSTVKSTKGDITADLGTTSATLEVRATDISDTDDTLVYTPSGVTVDGTPKSGQVSS